MIRSTLVFLLCLASELPALDLSVTVTPPSIEMGTFYKGARVRVAGTCDGGTTVVVAVRGAEAAEVFNVKGRAGPIWVNAGKVNVSGVPSLFLCFTSQPVRDSLASKVIEQYGLDFDRIVL